MCWIMAYHEEKIDPVNPNQNDKINNHESIRKDYFFSEEDYVNSNVSIDAIQIKDKTFYVFKHGGCSCDFFQSGLNKLTEDFEYFIGNRMVIQSLEPYILIKWLEDDETINNLPDTIIDIEADKIWKIFKEGNTDGLYRIIRN